MNTLDAMRSRRNVRQFSDRAIPAKELDQVLEMARRTPSSSNEQRWDFVLVTDRDQLKELAKVWQGAWQVAGSAATIGLVAPKVPDEHVRESIQYDLGQATMTIMLAAADLGIGSGHAWVKDQEQAQKVLGFPDDRFLAWLIALGYPADGPLKPIKELKRRPFDEVVHRGRW
jgi:nitroreductase